MKPGLQFIKASVDVNGEPYFVPGNDTNLYKMDRLKGEPKRVCVLPFANVATDVVLHGNDIWCVPLEGLAAAQYNIGSGNVNCYSGNPEDGRENLCAILFDGKIFIFPRYFHHSLYMFDMEKKEFMAEQSWYKEYSKHKLDGKILTGYREDNLLYMTLQHSKRLVQYDLSARQFRVEVLGAPDNLQCVTGMGGILYITLENSKSFLMFNRAADELKAYKVSGAEGGRYVRVLGMGDKLLLSAGTSLELWQENMEQPEKIADMECTDDRGSLFFCYAEADDGYYLLPGNAKKMVHLDKRGKLCGAVRLYMPMEDIIEKGVFYEEDFKLEEFMEVVCGLSNKEFNTKKDAAPIGNEIYRKVCEDLQWIG